MKQALLLCAGESTRMGQPKALCRLAGETLLGRILASLRAVGIESPRVILGAPHGSEIVAWLASRGLTAPQLVWNPEPSDGMLSSIQCGLRALPSSVVGTLLWPVDLPLVAVSTVRCLLQADAERLVIPTFGARGGHPVWLPQSRFAEVLALPRRASLRELSKRQPPLRLPVDDPEVLEDLDTPEALAQAELRLRR